jgi:hypothetical protein
MVKNGRFLASGGIFAKDPLAVKELTLSPQQAVHAAQKNLNFTMESG